MGNWFLTRRKEESVWVCGCVQGKVSVCVCVWVCDGERERESHEIKSDFDQPINQAASCVGLFRKRWLLLSLEYKRDSALCVFFHSLIVSRIREATSTATTTTTTTTTATAAATDPSLSQRTLLFCFLQKKKKTYFCRLDLTRDYGVIFLRFCDEKHIFTFVLNLVAGFFFWCGRENRKESSSKVPSLAGIWGLASLEPCQVPLGQVWLG